MLSNGGIDKLLTKQFPRTIPTRRVTTSTAIAIDQYLEEIKMNNQISFKIEFALLVRIISNSNVIKRFIG